MSGRHVLVLGGQRSGKSQFAEALVGKSGLDPVYLATATADDTEMARRIDLHRRRRGAAWRTLEEPLDLAGTLARKTTPDQAILVDCLTLWLSNWLGADRDPDAGADGLVGALEKADGAVVLVSGEVGSGIIPADAATRAYADALGTLNQRVAAAVGRVFLVTAGQPTLIKSPTLQPEFDL